MADVSTGPVSLLEEFKRGTAFEAALVSTYNLYFPFFEELVLRRLRSLGCSFVVTLADAGQVSAELADASRRPRAAGRRYALLPVAAPAAFHPKIGLFLGPRSARVIVGSHNLTMSGFGLNREVTNVIDVQGKKDREGAAAVQEVLEFSRAWAAHLFPALHKSLDDLAAFARDYQGPVPTDGAATVVGSRPDGESLWSRVLPHLPSTADRITVVGPFFDGELAFLDRVREDLKPDEIVIGVEPDTVSFPTEASLPSGSRLVDATSLCPGTNNDGYLHAKAILVESGDKRILLSGSANPTVAAWLANPSARNAEMVVVRQLDREDDDLGLGALSSGDAVTAATIEVSTPRKEPGADAAAQPRLLVGVASAGTVVVESPPAEVDSVTLLTSEGDQLAADFEAVEDKLVVSASAAEEAALFVVSADGVDYHGWVHHADSLRQLALSSSQRRIRDALGGLNGDPTRLEQLLKLVEKVVFRDAGADARGGRGGRRKQGEEESEKGESSVVIVPSLKAETGEALRRLSSGDLGLLLDVLMRQLWRSLSHEESTSTRSEGELIGSEDEDLVAELPTEPRVAEAWRKKTATLFRRLIRLVNEAEDKAQVVVQCAAVLGVLEAVRRIEDHDNWKRISAEFLDRDLARKFLLEAVPTLLVSDDGVLDGAVAEEGENFAEREALIRWLAWLCWIVGFGPAELIASLPKTDSPDDSIRALATVGLVSSRVAASPASDPRVLETLEASPRSGVQPDIWLADLLQLGETIAHPERAQRLERAPEPGDLVQVALPGKPPMFARQARGKNVELVDFSKSEAKLVIRADRVEVLQLFAGEASAALMGGRGR